MIDISESALYSARVPLRVNKVGRLCNKCIKVNHR
jgi:hypothetical protein